MGRPDELELIREMIAQGMHASAILLVDCPCCGNPSYYDGGQNCWCSWCGREISRVTDDEANIYTLDDYWSAADTPYPCDESEPG